MSPFTTVEIEGDPERMVAALPSTAGVGHIVGPQGRSLVVGKPANVRRWAAAHFGLGRPPAKGKRPRTNLTPIATAVAFAPSTSAFHQRLLYERLLSLHVPRARRRDLKPVAYLRLDPDERFPRLTVRSEGDRLDSAYGPFRDRRAAERALAVLHKVIPLRPCDYVFEPHPELPLGLGCLYAQVRTCAAPCLSRVSEHEYRALALRAKDVLARSDARTSDLEAVLPTFVSDTGARGIVAVSNGEEVELYPVAAGAVLDEARVRVEKDRVAMAVAGLCFDPPAEPRDDRAWLLACVAARKPAGAYVIVRPGEDLAAFGARVFEMLR